MSFTRTTATTDSRKQLQCRALYYPTGSSHFRGNVGYGSGDGKKVLIKILDISPCKVQSIDGGVDDSYGFVPMPVMQQSDRIDKSSLIAITAGVSDNRTALRFDLTKPPSLNPWDEFAGMFANDTDFASVKQNITQYRQSIDADPTMP